MRLKRGHTIFAAVLGALAAVACTPETTDVEGDTVLTPQDVLFPDHIGLTLPGDTASRDALDALTGEGDTLAADAAAAGDTSERHDGAAGNDSGAAPNDAETGLDATPCGYHTDCGADGMCTRSPATGAATCRPPCDGPGACPSGQVCIKVPGSAQIGACHSPNPAAAPNRRACNDHPDCQSGLCAGGQCVSGCTSEAACQNPDHSCQPVGDLAAGELGGACAPDPAGSLPNGAVCSADGVNVDSGLCASGHCDLLVDTPRCAPLCQGEEDCSPAQECSLVLLSARPAPGALPFDPLYQAPTHEAVTACFTPLGATAALPLGTRCDDNAQCGSNKCLALVPEDGRRWCTGLCTRDAACPAGMRCKPEVLLAQVSQWLLLDGGPVPEDARTLVRICKFE